MGFGILIFFKELFEKKRFENNFRAGVCGENFLKG